MRSIKAKQTEVFKSSLLPPKKSFQRLKNHFKDLQEQS